ncbi:MAG: tetratricopeptide repeat protein, partial [Lentisphaerota bacterium]
MVSSCELSQVLFPQFTQVQFPGAIVYRKETREPRPSEIFRFEEIRSQHEIVQPPMESATVFGRAAPPHPLHEINWVPVVESPSMEQAAGAEAWDISAQGRDAAVPDQRAGEETPRAVTLSIRALADQGKLREALTACEKAIAADKVDHELHYLRAIILQEQNNEVEAIASLKRALYLDPDFVPAHFAVGNLMLRQGNSRAAKICFENVLALLSPFRPEDILPEFEGLTAGRCREIIQATIQAGALV